jgi:hypothetical protein
MPQRGYLPIADITGYTVFLTESELEHAHGILETIFNSLLVVYRACPFRCDAFVLSWAVRGRNYKGYCPIISWKRREVRPKRLKLLRGTWSTACDRPVARLSIPMAARRCSSLRSSSPTACALRTVWSRSTLPRGRRLRSDMNDKSAMPRTTASIHTRLRARVLGWLPA